MNITFIGGSDGPTNIFLGGNLGFGWLNLSGLIVVVIMLIPNIIFAIKNKDYENKCKVKVMNVLEQISRYACMLLMIFNIGIGKKGFSSVEAFLAYFFGTIALLLAYIIIWIFYFKKKTNVKAMLLAFIPFAIFCLSGCTMRHMLLMLVAPLFGCSHMFVISQNFE